LSSYNHLSGHNW